MTWQKHKRKRGVILTPQALNKLEQAKSKAEFQENSGNRYTLENLSDRTGLGVDTLMKVFAGETGVDKHSLKCCFKAFNLNLKPSDYYYPKSEIEESEKSDPKQPASHVEPKLRGVQVPLDSPFYVERPRIESICYETLLQPGALLRLKGPNLMGKTSLMIRVLAQLAQENYRTASLSFELADRKTHFTNLNKFLRWFCLNLSRELGLSSPLDDYWDEEGMGSKVSCTTYFEEYLLAQGDSPLVLCLDDVDLLFPYPEIYEDFFGLLRSCHEKAKSRQCWKKLRLAIVHSTDVYIQLNINQSPFNVGLPIELSEFDSEQVQEFARLHGLEVNTELVEPLMKMVGGHPYLLQQAFSHLKSHPDITLEELLAEATTEAGIYRNHLHEHWLNLQEHPELALAFKKVVNATNPVELEPMLAYKLQSMGLGKLYGNQVEPRSNLYRQYFSEHLRNI
ncbi:MAG: AAA-like domain-containing protein [Xenococcaceae cyanobacterium]